MSEGMMDSECFGRRGFNDDRPAMETQAKAGPPESARALERRDFAYDLPPELIAQQPPARRGDSRLLTLDGASGALGDQWFRELPDLLRPGDLLVLNDTRVIPARLFGQKASGGRVEVLVERLLDERRALVHLHASKPPKPGGALRFDVGFAATVLGRRASCSKSASTATSHGWPCWNGMDKRPCRPTSAARRPRRIASAIKPSTPAGPARWPRRPLACTSTSSCSTN